MAYEKHFNYIAFAESFKNLPFTLNGSFYNSDFPTNCMYYHSNATYSTDCVCLIKCAVWCDFSFPHVVDTWVHPTIKYGLGDITCAKMIADCTDVSTDFTDMQIGELLYIKGSDGIDHVGIYVGEFTRLFMGETGTWNVIECTPIWSDGIQATWVDANGTRRNKKGGSIAGAWHKHGKLPFVNYEPNEKKTDGISFSIGEDINIIWKDAKTIEIKKERAKK